MKISFLENEVKIKSNILFKLIGVWAIFMVCMVLYNFLPLDEAFLIETPIDIFGIIFMTFWVLIVLALGLTAFMIGCKTVTINETGVICKYLWLQKKFTWLEIKDYGLSYSGRTRSAANIYDLYFAPKEQRVKNNCKKKLKGNMIKIYVIGDTYNEVITDLFLFCLKFTEIKPFIAEDKFHFI